MISLKTFCEFPNQSIQSYSRYTYINYERRIYYVCLAAHFHELNTNTHEHGRATSAVGTLMLDNTRKPTITSSRYRQCIDCSQLMWSADIYHSWKSLRCQRHKKINMKRYFSKKTKQKRFVDNIWPRLLGRPMTCEISVERYNQLSFINFITFLDSNRTQCRSDRSIAVYDLRKSSSTSQWMTKVTYFR